MIEARGYDIVGINSFGDAISSDPALHLLFN